MSSFIVFPATYQEDSWKETLQSLKRVLISLTVNELGNLPSDRLAENTVSILISYIQKYFLEKKYFVFPYNPKTIGHNVTENIVTQDLGGENFAVFTWGLKLIPKNIKGWFNLTPDPNLEKAMSQVLRVFKGNTYGPNKKPIFLSKGYLMLLVFEEYLRNYGKHPHFLLLSDRLFFGWINSFSYTNDAYNPFYLEYTLNFLAHPRSGYSIYDPTTLFKSIQVLPQEGIIQKVDFTNPTMWLSRGG